jgi:DNA-binding NarL/FixJ family response regulator
VREIKVLIVNDDYTFRTSLTENLLYYGQIPTECVSIATDGELAVGLLLAPGADKYDLIITGGNLKGRMKGPALIKEIRSLKGYGKTPIIIASQHPNYITEGIQAGATNYMEKPLDRMEEFLRRILSLLKLPYKGGRTFFRPKAGGLIAVYDGDKVIATIGTHENGFQVIHSPEIKTRVEEQEECQFATIFTIPSAP